jgi:hypothetical protein
MLTRKQGLEISLNPALEKELSQSDGAKFLLTNSLHLKEIRKTGA